MKKHISCLIVVLICLVISGCEKDGPEPDADFRLPESGTFHLVNYLGNEQNIHPKVIYFEKGWKGHRFWMAYTPYPVGNINHENPCIAVSEDGATWEDPNGISNPLYQQPENGYNSDTHLVYNPDDDSLEIWWRGFDIPTSRDYLMRRICRDGRKWSEPEIILPVSSDRSWGCLSPAVSIIDRKYVMLFSDGRRLYIMRSSSEAPSISWQSPIKVDVPDTGLNYWHQDMIVSDDGREAIVPVTCYTNNESHNAADLYGMVIDLANASGSKPRMLIKRGDIKPEFTSRSLYRSSLVRIGEQYILYYSCISKGDNFRHTDLITGNWNELYRYLNYADGQED